jgi:predicted amidophosphoribosyltransferase
MSLIKCPECGKEVSDTAISCPNCGKPMQTENSCEENVRRTKKPTLLGIVAIICGVIAICCCANLLFWIAAILGL